MPCGVSSDPIKRLVVLADEDRKEHDDDDDVLVIVELGVNAVRMVVKVASTMQRTVSTFRVIMVFLGLFVCI
jgi:hypothetical protein